jgi:streptomycin 6-kinase
MEHMLQLKRISMEMKTIKMWKFKQTKVLKEQPNVLDHERKLKMIQFTASMHQGKKSQEQKRKQDAKLKKFQGRTEEIGVLHGDLHKQNTVNGGCVPNPGWYLVP